MVFYTKIVFDKNDLYLFFSIKIVYILNMIYEL